MIIPRPEHNVSRANISAAALKVLYTLRDAGFQAFLVGGGVRDLLLEQSPKDFDVATDAHPEQVKALFRNCRLIGRRFRLAHVRFGRDIVEVATFRGTAAEDDDGNDDRVTVNGRIVRDNVYGTLEEDAWRRDFSVNSLYYDIRDFSLLDYTGGMEDIKTRTLRLIGDPDVRLREDPVRMLRAIRFAAKLGFRLDPAISTAIPQYADLLAEIPPARLYDEVLKLFMAGSAVDTLELLQRYRLLEFLFPETAICFEDDDFGPGAAMVRLALENTDKRVAEDKPVTPAFLFAALLWPPMQRDAEALLAQGMSEMQAYETAGSDIIARQAGHVALPKRFSVLTREIWNTQPQLVRQRGKRALGLLGHPRFRAAYDFMLLRAQAGEPVGDIAEWWTKVQQHQGEDREKLLEAPQQQQPPQSAQPATRRKRRKRRRRGGGRSKAASAPPAP